ncbi:unnamed protein product [Brachionus calyciflorus]|uniref:C2H2-type domain-containing protein n=1 Tax=Brachionus calyciflorus TaxID=104777 RepID=A0A813XFK2_9BILA|nr:unnamed protein product [Brachionus calyciflorus]
MINQTVMNSNLIQKMDIFNSKYKCRICRKRLRYKADEIIHTEILHSSKFDINSNILNYECPLCDHKFKSIYNLRLHLMKIHLNERPYGCRLCNKKFLNFIELKKHCKKHVHKKIEEMIEYDNSAAIDYSINQVLINYLFKIALKPACKFVIIVEKIIKKCFKCPSLYNSNSEYLAHIWSCHMNQNSPNCWQCKLKFQRQIDLNEHLKFHCDEKLFKCSLCLKSKCFDSLESAKEHFKSFHMNNNNLNGYSFELICSNCNETIPNEDYLLTHHNQCLNKKDLKFKCFYCDFVFDEQNILEIHLEQHRVYNEKLNFQKTYFLDSFLTQSFRRNKIDDIALKIISMKEKKQKDSEKEREENLIQYSPFLVYPSNSAFNPPDEKFKNFSLNYFSQQYPLLLNKCDYCGFMFRNSYELEAHKLMHSTSNTKRPFKCHLCLVTFSKLDQLKRHMIVHQVKDQDFVCQICFSSFSRKQDLDRHLLFHSK